MFHRRLSSTSLALALLLGSVGMVHKPDGDPPAPGTPPVVPPVVPPVTPPVVPPATPPAPPELAPEVKAQLEELKTMKAAAAEAARATLSETDKLKADLAAAEARALDSLRAAVGARLGLPKEIAGRLKGGTEAEIEADGQALAKFMPATPPPLGNTGAPPATPPAPAGELATKEAELVEAQKKGDRFAYMRLLREVSALQAKAGK
jgi:hypothetical protein